MNFLEFLETIDFITNLNVIFRIRIAIRALEKIHEIGDR